jgi:hypothetical protein
MNQFDAELTSHTFARAVVVLKRHLLRAPSIVNNAANVLRHGVASLRSLKFRPLSEQMCFLCVTALPALQRDNTLRTTRTIVNSKQTSGFALDWSVHFRKKSLAAKCKCRLDLSREKGPAG